MTDQDSKRSLEEKGDDLAKRLHQARQAELGTKRSEPKLRNEVSGLGQAFRIGAELISGLVVGVGLGWWLDGVLDTKPWMMIICIFLGGAAGMLNVYRTAMRMVDDLNEDSDESEALGATNGNESDPSDQSDPKK